MHRRRVVPHRVLAFANEKSSRLAADYILNEKRTRTFELATKVTDPCQDSNGKV